MNPDTKCRGAINYSTPCLEHTKWGQAGRSMVPDACQMRVEQSTANFSPSVVHTTCPKSAVLRSELSVHSLRGALYSLPKRRELGWSNTFEPPNHSHRAVYTHSGADATCRQPRNASHHRMLNLLHLKMVTGVIHCTHSGSSTAKWVECTLLAKVRCIYWQRRVSSFWLRSANMRIRMEHAVFAEL